MSRTAVFTVIFPAALPFLNDFIKSLNQQTYQHFDLVIANDGIENLQSYLTELKMACRILPVENTPAKIRQQGLDFLRAENYDQVIFTDSDDMLSSNRVEVARCFLESYAIVCNDLSPFFTPDNITRGYWQSRLTDGTEIARPFLEDKNILGLGNTAINGHVLKSIEIPADLVAVDWFLFYELLGKDKAVFTTQCETLYRQHAGNTIGLKKIDEARLRNILSVKKTHYTLLQERGYDMRLRLDQLVSAEHLINSGHDGLKARLDLLNGQEINYFWWEETNYLV